MIYILTSARPPPLPRPRAPACASVWMKEGGWKARLYKTGIKLHPAGWTAVPDRTKCTGCRAHVTEAARRRNPAIEILPISARTGEGVAAVAEWILRAVAEWNG